MNRPGLNEAHQLVIVMRIAEFCRWDHRVARHYDSPWEYMRDKLLQTEEALSGLKNQLLEAIREGLLKELDSGPMKEERFSDYKDLLEKLLSPSDFADVAMQLSSAGKGPNPGWVRELLNKTHASHLFIEEARPPGARSLSWEKLVAEIYERLDLVRLGKVLENGERTPRRRSLVLRRMRANTKEYCSVVHIPTSADETFTPFMLPRIEAVIAANLRFLNKYR